MEGGRIGVAFEVETSRIENYGLTKMANSGNSWAQFDKTHTCRTKSALGLTEDNCFTLSLFAEAEKWNEAIRSSAKHTPKN